MPIADPGPAAASGDTRDQRPSADGRADFDAAWDEFFAAIRRARGRAAQEAEREGLSLAQFQLLYPFAERDRVDSLPVGALADAAGVAQPTATRTLDALERHGVVERRPSSEDRRSVIVALTARGRRLLDHKRDLVAAKRRAVYESLEPGDRERAAGLLRALAAAIGERR
ncbi:MAG: MarR family transcriptional regulator [Solirubrobacterales bacterium]|nr:MarR family transcriptional regulator [Solirubrobacterales bacterium]